MATGRKLYSRYSKILKCSAKAIGLLPRSVRNSLLRLFQNTGGNRYPLYSRQDFSQKLWK